MVAAFFQPQTDGTAMNLRKYSRNYLSALGLEGGPGRRSLERRRLESQLRPCAGVAASLIRLDVCGQDAPVGLRKSFDVNFGSNSDRTILLLKFGRFGDDNRPLRNHPDPQKVASR